MSRTLLAECNGQLSTEHPDPDETRETEFHRTLDELVAMEDD